MKFEFTVDTDAALVTVFAPLSVDEHSDLVWLAREAGLTAFLTFEDFYEEHHLVWSSLDPLLGDLGRLVELLDARPTLQSVATRLRKLVAEAIARRCDLSVLPD